MTIDIESLRLLCTNTTITLTKHAAIRMYERKVKYLGIKSAIMNGDIIEEYLDESPNPRVLISGHDEAGKPLHVVVGVGDWNIEIISAYYPSLEKWEADYKTRKVVK